MLRHFVGSVFQNKVDIQRKFHNHYKHTVDTVEPKIIFNGTFIENVAIRATFSLSDMKNINNFTCLTLVCNVAV